MTKEYLLNASKKEFEDKEENALLWKCKRIYTSSGYAYLVKQTSKKISCAIHFARNFDTSEEIGKYENIEVVLNTFEEIPFDDAVIEYKGFVVAMLSQRNYNAEMKMFHYNGVGSFESISKMFFVTSEDEISENLGVNSMQIFCELKKDYPIVPSYFKADSVKKFIMCDVEESNEGLNTAIFKNAAGELVSRKSDNVKLTFVNFTRDEAMAEMARIQEESLKPSTSFGILTPPKLENKYMYQLAFSWKSNTYIATFTAFYFLRSAAKVSQPAIQKIVYEQLQAI